MQASHLLWLLLVQSEALGAQVSILAALRLSGLEARGIFLAQGSNPCPLHWQVDS